MNLDQEKLDESWQQVRKEELDAVAARRKKANLADHPGARLEDTLTGLALSGGGIRSASFSLGVVQALVESGLFRHLDFLSTVSGGGYAGAFISSLAYRQHLDKKKQAPKADHPYHPPPIVPKADGSEPPSTTTLAKRSNFLNDYLDFCSRYLIGWFLNLVTFLSVLLFLCTLIALAWRVLDMPVIVDFLTYTSSGWIGDWNRPFLPALVFFVLWVFTWTYSYFQKGSVATARRSGTYLVATGTCLLIGAAIWLGTPNMNVQSDAKAHAEPHASSLWNGHQELLLPLLLAWLATLVPFVRPLQLLKSGADTSSLWKGWVFHIAGYGLIVGIPFVTVFAVGRHNVSLVAHGWQRDLVPSDIIDWEQFWEQIRKEKSGDHIDDFLTPGVLLLEKLEPLTKDGKKSGVEVMQVVQDAKDLYALQKWNLHRNRTIARYYTDLNTKDTIVYFVNLALVDEYLLDPEAARAEVEKEIMHGFFDDGSAFQLNDKIFKYPGFLQGLPADLRHALIESLSQRSADKRAEIPAGEPDDSQPERAHLIRTLRAQAAGMDEAVAQLKRHHRTHGYRQTIDDKIQATLEAYKQESDAYKEAKELQSIVAQHKFYQNSSAREEWVKNEYVGEDLHRIAAHLLLRLYYRDQLRPVQLANRPTVIMQDQWVRLWILGASGAAALFLGFSINFNGTSMHGYYRRCIQRAFLVRHADADDDSEHREILLKDLTNTEEGYPYHILSGCVEIETGRRGDPAQLVGFQFAKLYCGGRHLDFTKTPHYRRGAMTLSSAAAISGAAVSPLRIRYLLLEILLTVLNARLGQWLPNPPKNNALLLPPGFVPLLRLLWNKRKSATMNQSMLFVSDGGHYENLGVDMLLERRCRFIIASDAGQDPNFEFADLANLFAIARRKGIQLFQFQPGHPGADEEITFERVQYKFQLGDNMAMWKIQYPDAPDGFCIYIKSSLPRPQPFEIGQYKLLHDEFPHDSTVNQFFHEQQFEVYRSLGYHLAWQALQRLDFNAQTQGDQLIDIERLLQTGMLTPRPTGDGAEKAAAP